MGYLIQLLTSTLQRMKHHVNADDLLQCPPIWVTREAKATHETEAGAMYPVTLETSQNRENQVSSEFHEEEHLGGRSL